MQCVGIVHHGDGLEFSRFVCMVFCYTDRDCPSDRTCDYVAIPGTGYRICGPGWMVCDPFGGAPCPTADGCTVVPPWSGRAASTICTPAGAAAPGERCDLPPADCAVGAGCYHTDTDGDTRIGPHDEGRCFAYCDLDGGPHTCPAGEGCAAVLEHPTVGICM